MIIILYEGVGELFKSNLIILQTKELFYLQNNSTNFTQEVHVKDSSSVWHFMGAFEKKSSNSIGVQKIIIIFIVITNKFDFYCCYWLLLLFKK